MQVEGVATPRQNGDNNNSNTWNSKIIWSAGYASVWKECGERIMHDIPFLH